MRRAFQTLRPLLRSSAQDYIPQFEILLKMPSIPGINQAVNGETANGYSSQWQGTTLAALPKSHVFTQNLPPDPLIPSPEASKEAPQVQLRTSRPVRSALFTWVAPEKNENPQVLATSWKAMKDLGLNPGEAETEDFKSLMGGNKIYEEHYPWGMSSLKKDVNCSTKLWRMAVWDMGFTIR